MIRIVLALWIALCGVANAQLAGGLQFPGPGLPVNGTVGPPTVIFGAAANAVNGSVNPQVSASISIGSVAYDRTVFFEFIANSHSPITSVTVTPNVGTAITTTSMDVSQTAATQMLAIGHVSLLSDAQAATTVVVSVTTTGTLFTGFVFATYYTKTSDIASLTPTGSFVAGPTATTQTVNGSLTTSSGGFVIAVGGNSNITSNSTTFTGTETYTKDADGNVFGVQRAFAHVNSTAANGASLLTETFAQLGTTVLVAAAYR